MSDFNTLRQQVDALLLKYPRDTSIIRYLSNLSKQINSEELYYKSIPSNIKTSNTLIYIIQKLSFKINQADYKYTHQNQLLNIAANINPNYVNTDFQAVDTDVIDFAYIQANGTIIP